MATTINLEVDRATKTALQRIAKAKKVSVSVIVRWAIQEYLDRQNDQSEKSKEQLSA